MLKKWKRPIGTCARCGEKVVNGDWVLYCKLYTILGKNVILHFCKPCFKRDE